MPTKPISGLPNRRACRRSGLRRPCTVDLPGQKPRETLTRDVGIDGLSLLSPRPIAPGTLCRVAFELPLGSRSVPVQARAKVVYSSLSGSEGFKIGAVFTEIAADSAAAIREFCGEGA